MFNTVNQQTTKKNKEDRKEQIELKSTRKKTNKITGTRKYLSIITLNVNGLKSPIKRCRLADRIKEL
jgi:hypothetical protein